MVLKQGGKGEELRSGERWPRAANLREGMFVLSYIYTYTHTHSHSHTDSHGLAHTWLHLEFDLHGPLLGRLRSEAAGEKLKATGSR